MPISPWQELAARMALGGSKPGMPSPGAPMPPPSGGGMLAGAMPGADQFAPQFTAGAPTGWGPYAGPVEGQNTVNPAVRAAVPADTTPLPGMVMDPGGGSSANGGSGFGGPTAEQSAAMEAQDRERSDSGQPAGAGTSEGVGTGGPSGAPDGGGTGADPDGGAAYAVGGVVDELTGPDPAGPDDGSAALDRGEYVVQQQAVENVGTEVLDAINKGDLETAVELLEAKLGGEPEGDTETAEEDAETGDGVEDALRKTMKGLPSRP